MDTDHLSLFIYAQVCCEDWQVDNGYLSVKMTTPDPFLTQNIKIKPKYILYHSLLKIL